MPDIILLTLNAGYAHSAFGLRCLHANLGELAARAEILEFSGETRTADIAEAVLSRSPRIVGIGLHIWNAAECALLAAELKALRPGLKLVMGGPELGPAPDGDGPWRDADYVISGEAELAFAELCRALLAGEPPANRFIKAPPPDPARLELPYHLYSGEDISNRVLYAESSRGCPFACDFCLSSVGGPVRLFPLDRLFAAWNALLARGARRFKFVDRTFNLDPRRAAAILEFFLPRASDGLFLHFEMVPDRLPEELLGPISRFPPGALQFELGIQTFNEDAAARISRRQDNAAAERNLLRLRRETGAHLHADLVIGLPGESLESFAAGFDRLMALAPHEIQLVTLKKLRGAPIARHDREWKMVYSPYPPYELRENGLLDFFTVQRLRRFARYWELVANSGIFVRTSPLLTAGPSPFRSFLAFSDWLYGQTGRTHAISRTALRGLLRAYLTGVLKLPAGEVDKALESDALNCGRAAKSGVPPRQALHLAS